MTSQQQADEALHEMWTEQDARLSRAANAKTRNAWADRNRREARRRRNFRALELIAGGLFMLTLAMGLIVGMAI